MLNACHFGPGCHDFRSEPFMLSPLYPCSISDLAIVGLLDGDGLDEIYHVIKLVLLGFDP